MNGPSEVLAGLWRHTGLPCDALDFADLPGTDPVYPSSFAVGAAAQASVAAAALAACELGHRRGQPRQRVAVDMTHASVECRGWFSVDGRVPELWDPFSGLYRCKDGWVRVHANFRHHRDGALRLLGLDPASATRGQAEQAMLQWPALAYEEASAAAGLVATALRSFDAWDATEQGHAIALQPLLTLERIGEAEPLPLPDLHADARPLHGLRVLDLTRILAGPVGGRALAAYGADVMLLNSPHLPNIEAIADTSRGKRAAHVDLRTPQGRADFEALVRGAHVLVQGYRPGGLEALGYGPQELARLRPGLVCVWLSAYGTQGPWAGRRGFDSLVQTAMGFNHAEGQAAGAGPKAVPIQIQHLASAYNIARLASAAINRQQQEGGSWLVRLSLAQTGHWLRSLPRVQDGLQATAPAMEPYLEDLPSGFGRLRCVRHSAMLSRTPVAWDRPSVPPGHSPPRW